MTKTGPQKYPGASTAYWYGSKYPGSAMESNVIVWHSTEGTSLPSYGGGSSAPNFTAVPDFTAKKLKWYQHFDFDVSSRALVNKSGGVETNTLNVVQVEITGTCDPATHKKWTNAGYKHLYMPELPDWALRDLHAFAQWAHDKHGVPLTSGVTFKPYPGSYGANGVRMSGSKWNSFKGHCGHQHVPENDHGDPGNINITAILKGVTTEPPKETEDMPETIGLYQEIDKKLSAREWTTLTVDGKTDLATGIKSYTAGMHLVLEPGPYACTIQGRFYHLRPDGSRWNGPLMEMETTEGKTFAAFFNSGSIAADEKLRFEAIFYPLDPTDEAGRKVLTAQLRGLSWS